jgi:hypothetical protein
LLLRLLASLLLGAVGAHVCLQPFLPLLRVRRLATSGDEVLRAAFASDTEAKELGLVKEDLGREDQLLAVLLEENVGKGRTEEGPVKSISARGDVHLLALGAIDLDSILTKLVGQAVRDDALLVTEGSGTVPVGTLQVLSVYERQSYTERFRPVRCAGCTYLRAIGCTERG